MRTSVGARSPITTMKATDKTAVEVVAEEAIMVGNMLRTSLKSLRRDRVDVDSGRNSAGLPQRREIE